ncbi:hypothetical protein HDV00_002719 [Rhizophlyctis rosea]|nr:hypothetical protein HDV00_002719 [Rhizophlyctis rosea]
MQIVTKVGIRAGATPGHYNLSEEYILKRVKESLEALGTEYVDVLLVHRPSPLMDADVVARAFKSLHSAGKVHHFGVSNFTTQQYTLLQSRLDFPLVTNQLELHPLNLDVFHDGTLEYLQQVRVAPMAWSPLAGGRLVKPSGDERVTRVQEAVVKVAGEVVRGRGEEFTDDQVERLSSQVIYAWLLKHPSKICVVIGTNSLERIEHAVGALDVELSLEQWFRILEASAGQPVP